MHEYQVTCACGYRWRVEAADEPDSVECLACGADALELSDLGEIHGR